MAAPEGIEEISNFMYDTIGFMNSSVGLEHALGHALGTSHHVHHGIAVGVFLSVAVAYISKVSENI